MPIYGTDNLDAIKIRPAPAPVVVDTYVKPAQPQVDDTLSKLAEGLSKLGGALKGHGAAGAASKDREDMQNLEFYKAKYKHFNETIANDLRTGAPLKVQVGEMDPSLSPTVQARIMESIGNDVAGTRLHELQEQLLQDEQLRLDKNAFDGKLDGLLAEEEKRIVAGGNVPWGSGYIGAFRKGVERLKAGTQEERAKWYQIKQQEIYARQTQEAARTAKEGTSVGWTTKPVTELPALRAALPAGKSEDHLRGLQGEFATRLDKMIAEAPPEVRSALQINSGYRSVERQAEIFRDAVAKHGSEAKARKWAAPPGKSNHNHGHAVDLVAKGAAARDFHKTAAGQWVHANAEKYGLYFPMGHEPWHVEMVGGRRQTGGRGPTVVDLNDDDGDHDDGYAVDNVTAKIIGVESSGNPTAQNSRSSAGGLGQYIDDTWIASARKHGGTRVASLSDDAILALKKDSSPEGIAFHKEVLRKDIEGYAQALQKEGLALTEGNLYLMHFAGTGGAAKALKASDSAKVSAVLGDKVISANRFDPNMTIGELKAWSAEKMGSVTPTTRAVHNAVRRVDQEWRDSGGIGNIARREAIAHDLKSRAVSLNDASILNDMPPELMTPRLAADFEAAKRQIATVNRAEEERAFQMQRRAQEARKEALYQEINTKIANGENVDLRDPRYHEDKAVFEYARQNMINEVHVDPLQSQMAIDSIGRAIDAAAASGDWSEVMGPGWKKGDPVTVGQITQYIGAAKGIKMADKLELQKTLKVRLDSMVQVGGDEAKSLFNDRMKDYLTVEQQALDIKHANKGGAGINLFDAAKSAYEAELRLRFGEYAKQHGEPISGDAKIAAYNEAMKAAKEKVKDVLEVLRNGEQAPQAPSAPSMTPKPGATPAKPRFHMHPDGVMRLTPPPGATQQQAPQAPPAAKPTASPAKPAVPVDPLEAVINPAGDVAIPAIPAAAAVPAIQLQPEAPAAAPGPAAVGGSTVHEGDLATDANPTPPAEKPKKAAEAKIAVSTEGNIKLDLPPDVTMAVQATLGRLSNDKPITEYLKDYFPVLKDMAEQRTTQNRQKVETVRSWFAEDDMWKTLNAKVSNAKPKDRPWAEQDLKAYEEELAERLIQQFRAASP